MINEVKILMVEDNEGDIMLTTQILKKERVANSISVARDGGEAVKYLRKEERFKDVETPDFILLNINRPKINGMKVLTKIKNDEILRSIPVVILTTSDSEKDIMAPYHNYPNCYIVKPVGFKKIHGGGANNQRFLDHYCEVAQPLNTGNKYIKSITFNFSI
jgi:CheY-like chemotaxis protein